MHGEFPPIDSYRCFRARKGHRGQRYEDRELAHSIISIDTLRLEVRGPANRMNGLVPKAAIHAIHAATRG